MIDIMRNGGTKINAHDKCLCRYFSIFSMNVKHIQESFRLSLVFDVSKALCITICIICFF